MKIRRLPDSWLAALVLIPFLLAACGDSDEAPPSEPSYQPAQVARNEQNETVVRLPAEVQERIGLQTTRTAVETRQPELTAYGRLEEDPSTAFVVRAPVSGIVRSAPNSNWPSLGDPVTSGAVVGQLQPRLAPADRINLTDRLLQVRGDVQAAEGSSEAARAAYERSQQLNADNKNISDRALQEAQSRWATEQARLTAAKGVLAFIESSLQSAETQTFVALTVEKSGEVTEVMALPGEEVTAGTPLLRLVRFDRLLARIELPVGQTIPSKPTSARIVPVGREELSIRARPVAVSASVDPRIQGQSLLFLLTGNPVRLRPGLAVTAYLSIPGSPRRVTVVPSSAVVRHAGTSFVYVRTSEEEFVRRPLSDLRPARGGYLVEEGLSSGEEVVTQGAQLLLSEELKSFISVGEDE
jgi:hypothetical protein